MRWCGDAQRGSIPEPGDDLCHEVDVAAIRQYEALQVPAPVRLADGWRRL